VAVRPALTQHAELVEAAVRSDRIFRPSPFDELRVLRMLKMLGESHKRCS